MDILLAIVAIALVLGIAFLMSNDKRNIPVKGIGIMLLIQFALTWFMFNTDIGQTIIIGISNVFSKLIEFGMSGVNFVFGGLAFENPDNPQVFFLNVLLIIVFFATILSVLTHFKILPIIIKYVGGFISKITGLPKIESFNAVNSMFFGQSEALIAIKSQFHRLTDNRLYIVSASAMGSVSASIVGAYMEIIPPQYVLVAIPLNMFSALILASIIAPVKVEDEDDEVDVKNVSQSKSVFEAMANGALDGGRIALIVAAMLIAFLASLEMVNWVIGAVASGWTLEELLGYALAPITFLMGVAPGELVSAGSFMGTKIITNEFVAMSQFMEVSGDLSEKTVGIVSVFLTSFANFSSIGIIAGTVAGIDSEKGKTISSFGMKLLIGATLASILSATIAGMFL
ncbi:NupC/NupG family nucleoside CNT transporter [Halalkalibacillus sediminis]|uniref:NupC/NupG family nucleoside CNT transporter n=1 Tax=Halalkalibacillus sediminis TaxID=2018042 RepID=A0A2I0QV79_9BACI|nr:nucleoside transporter C-terminal domain-containing protein [Halalkalibacillus sediminis]PKR78228.1 NupC/NupG family nucleoside CNT transporter [Halalkalibacillus sediminis]